MRIDAIEQQLRRQNSFTWSSGAQIVEKIRRHFNESEVESLMMLLDIDSEEIQGETHSHRVREFINYCQRRDMLIPLIAACIEERPFVKWPTLK